MISITVKCLDSSNYNFEVSPELTVKQFKEHIERDVKIPAESQRMIYCGRVLKDDQKLEQHDLDGKAIHLVERPPPTAGAAREEAGRDSPPPHHIHQRPGGPNVRHTAFRLGGPPPVNLPSSSQMRASTAQRMFNGARSTLQRIGVRDDDDANPLDFSVSDLGNRYGETIAHSVEVEIPMGNVNNPDTQAAVSAALAAVAQSMGMPGMQGLPQGSTGPFVVRSGPQDGTGVPNFGGMGGMPIPGVLFEVPDGGIDVHVHNGGLAHGQQRQAEQQAASGGQQTQSERRRASSLPRTSAAGGSEGVPPSSPGGSRQPRVGVMADLIEDLQSIQETLRPHVDRVRSLLRNDPTFANQEEELEAQHIFRRVSETFHYLAHGYHALSDLMVDFRRSPPRNLYGVPYLVQSMAVVQGVFPIQAEIQIRANVNQPQEGGTAAAPSAPPAPPGDDSSQPANGPASRSEEPSAPSADVPRAPPGNFGFRIPLHPFGPGNIVNMFGGAVGPGQGPRRPINPAQRPTMSTNIANLVGSLFRGAAPGAQGPVPPPRAPPNPCPHAPPTSQQIPRSPLQSQGLRPVPPPVPISSVVPGSGSFDEFLPCSSHHLSNRNRQGRSNATQTPRSSNNAEPMDLDSDPVVNSDSIPAQPWHSRVPQPWISVITRDTANLDAIYSRRPSFSYDYIEEMPPQYRERFQRRVTGQMPAPSRQEGSTTNNQDVMDVDAETSQKSNAKVNPVVESDSDEDL